MEQVESYLSRIRDHFERHIAELDSQHEKLWRKYQGALKRNEQEKARKYDERLDKSEEELKEFNEYVQRLLELISYVSKPLDEQSVTEQLEVLKYLKEMRDSN